MLLSLQKKQCDAFILVVHLMYEVHSGVVGVATFNYDISFVCTDLLSAMHHVSGTILLLFFQDHKHVYTKFYDNFILTTFQQ